MIAIDATASGSFDLSATSPFRIVFVCTGNICRSPLAEALARIHAGNAGLAGQVHFESFGTHGYHVGEGADARTQVTARRLGVDLAAHRARRIGADDCRRADLILAMDGSHEASLRRLAPSVVAHRLHRYLPWLGMAPVQDVPDPYYGDDQGFLEVHRLLDAASARLAARLPELLRDRDGR